MILRRRPFVDNQDKLYKSGSFRGLCVLLCYSLAASDGANSYVCQRLDELCFVWSCRSPLKVSLRHSPYHREHLTIYQTLMRRVGGNDFGIVTIPNSRPSKRAKLEASHSAPQRALACGW